MTEPFPVKNSAADRATVPAPAAADTEAESNLPQRARIAVRGLTFRMGFGSRHPHFLCCDAFAEAYPERVHFGHTTSSLLYTI